MTVNDSYQVVAFGDEADLLVGGSRRNGPPRRLVLASASDHLVRHVDGPLVVTAAVAARWQERHAEASGHGSR